MNIAEFIRRVFRFPQKRFRKVLCLDFDNTVCAYDGWKGARVITGKPIDGMIELMFDALQADWDVVIHSSRAAHWGGRRAMRKWLKEYAGNLWNEGMGYVGLEDVRFTVAKPPAFVTLDDRTIQFTGIAPSIEELEAFKPWNKRKNSVALAEESATASWVRENGSVGTTANVIDGRPHPTLEECGGNIREWANAPGAGSPSAFSANVNASLLAAAPALLTACRTLLQIVHNEFEQPQLDRYALELGQVEVAVAKVERDGGVLASALIEAAPELYASLEKCAVSLGARLSKDDPDGKIPGTLEGQSVTPRLKPGALKSPDY